MSAITRVRRMQKSDVPDVVEVHLAAFPGFFMSFLGEGFLRLYYESIHDLGQLCFVGLRESEVVGFVAGIEDSFGFYRALLRYRIHRFALVAVPAFLKDPRIGPRLIRALLRRSGGEGRRGNSITLTSIAVRPELQGRGLADGLVDRFTEEAAERGADWVYLETDAVDNDRVCGFYEKEGFEICREYTTPEGRKMREYRLEISRRQESRTG